MEGLQRLVRQAGGFPGKGKQEGGDGRAVVKEGVGRSLFVDLRFWGRI